MITVNVFVDKFGAVKLPLSFWDWVQLKLHGRVFLFYAAEKGWRRTSPFYLAECKKHGYFIDYPHGYYRRLDCPFCLRNRRVE